MSSFGQLFKITTFGESHCDSVGVIVENMIPKVQLDLVYIQKQLNRRRPGQSHITTSRAEPDTLELLSGMERGMTLGTPLAFRVENRDTRPGDYKFDENEYLPRPSHADMTYIWKYGIHSASGGGRSSARETVGRVIGGSIADQILGNCNCRVVAFVSQVGNIRLNVSRKDMLALTRDFIDTFVTRCPNGAADKRIESLILKLKKKGDSVGGKVTCIVTAPPKGLGEPVFNKTEALLAHAMLSIPATKGFEIGSGFGCIQQTGSEHNDPWITDNSGNIRTLTNNSGGTLGGITNGEPIIFSVAFKPPATIKMDQNTVNLKGEYRRIKAKGRHDPCVVARAVPIVEAMASLVLVDLIYQHRSRLTL